jgi:hypothetical protein
MNKKLLVTLAVAVFAVSGIALVKAGAGSSGGVKEQPKGVGSSGGVKESTVVPAGRESHGIVPPGRESNG